MSNEIFSTRNTASLQGIFLVYYYIICLSDNIKRLAGHVSHCKALNVQYIVQYGTPKIMILKNTRGTS